MGRSNSELFKDREQGSCRAKNGFLESQFNRPNYHAVCVIFYRLTSRHKHVPTHTVLISVAVSDIADGWTLKTPWGNSRGIAKISLAVSLRMSAPWVYQTELGTLGEASAISSGGFPGKWIPPQTVELWFCPFRPHIKPKMGMNHETHASSPSACKNLGHILMGHLEHAGEIRSSLYLPKPALLAGGWGTTKPKSCLNALTVLWFFF